MSSKSFTEISERINSSSGLIFVDTFEEQRLIREIKEKFEKDSVQFWSISQGLHEIELLQKDINKIKLCSYNPIKARKLPGERGASSIGSPLAVLEIIENDSRQKIDNSTNVHQKTIYVLRDLDKFFNNPMVVRKIRDIVYLAARAANTMIITGAGLKVPEDLLKDSCFISLELPRREEIKDYLIEKKILPIIKAHNKEVKDKKQTDDLFSEEFDIDKVIKAYLGLTEDEIINISSFSLTKTKTLDPTIIFEEKKQIVNKSDVLEYWNCDMDMDDIGGFDVLKNWFLIQKKVMDSDEAAATFHADPAKGILMIGVQGSGKAQPLYSNVMMADSSWKKMGDLEIGDFVMTPEGKSSKITEIFEHKNKENTLITFRDGRYVECCKDHLWKIYNKSFKRNPETSDGWKIVDTNKLEEYLDMRTDTHRFYIPLLNIQYQESNLPIDPYILGVLIGDGCIRKSVNFTVNDIEIVEKVKSKLLKGYHISEKKERTCMSYRIVQTDYNGHTKNIYTKGLIDLGLFGKYSTEKFIPSQYMNASTQQRIELLRGLMDTDGSCDGNLSFSTASKKLANDVINLVRSIGGIAFGTPRITKCEDKEFPSIRVNIRYRNPKELVSLKRKQDTLSNDYQYSDLKLEVMSIEHIGKEDMRCIIIDDKEHLYITDNYVVTHNTASAKALAKTWGKGLIKLDMGNMFAGLVGESIAPDEEFLFYTKEGAIFRMTAEQAYEYQPDVYIQSATTNFRSELKKVTSFIQHKRVSTLVKIKTFSGREIKVTEDHSLFTISGSGQLMEVKPTELSKNNVIVVPMNLKEPLNPITKFDLIDLINCKGQEDKWLLCNAWKYYGEKIKDWVDEKSVSSYEKNNRPLLLSKIHETYPERCEIKGLGTHTIYGNILTITPFIMELFGWYSAEGSISGTGNVRLHINKNEEQEVGQLITKCGFTYKSYIDADSNGITLYIGDTALGFIFDCLLLINKDRVPVWIYNISKTNRIGYLKGFFSGDGGNSGNHIEVSQKNETFLKDIMLLLSTIGISCSIYPRRDGGYRLIIHSSIYKKKYFDIVGFTQKEKMNVLEDIILENDDNWGHKFPLYADMKKDQIVSKLGLLQNNTISYKNAIKINPDIENWDFDFDRIKSIEICEEQPEYVYDLSVENNENFVCGLGGILCHNSEKRMRMALKQAEAAGGILIIDELDKGLAGAGSSDRTDGGTTKRVIGTLLTWMDKPHPGLFIIATANDISQLRDNHPELFRKGRFDDMFFSDAPTKEERMDIFAIHLRRRGRDSKKFDLEKLADANYTVGGTEYNYVGAEIEYAVKEAVNWKFAEKFSKDNLKIGGKDDIKTEDIIDQLKKIKPIMFVGKTAVSKNREWAKDNATNVSSKGKDKKTEEKSEAATFNIHDDVSL